MKKSNKKNIADYLYKIGTRNCRFSYPTKEYCFSHLCSCLTRQIDGINYLSTDPYIFLGKLLKNNQYKEYKECAKHLLNKLNYFKRVQ